MKKKGGRYASSGRTHWLVPALIVGMLVLLVSAGGFLLGYFGSGQEASAELSTESVQTVAETFATPETTQSPPTAPETVPATQATTVPTTEATLPTQPEVTEPPVMLSQYQDRYAENPELYGWIRIDGTPIDYPLMRSPEEPDKYLYADFYGNYLFAGSIYADAKSSFQTDNMLIYGHNLLDGSRFRSLMNYENKSYWESHPTIYLSDLYNEYEYEIVAAFRDRVYLKTDTCFKFYQFIDADNEEEFDYAVSQFKEKAIYDTGVEAHYGDHLITLITCAYHVDHGRFVVVARRK